MKGKTAGRHRTYFTLSELCDIAGVAVPPNMVQRQHETLTTVTGVRKYIEKGCAYLLSPVSSREDTISAVSYARSMGALAIFLKKSQQEFFEDTSDLIACQNTLTVQRRLVKKLRSDAGITVVGVTGSLGKTTTKDLIHGVLKQHFKTGKSMGNQNQLAPMLHNLQRLDPDLEMYVQEFGIGAKGAMPRDAAAFTPDCAVITCIAEAHIGTFGSLEGICQEKLGIVRAMPQGRPVFLCKDDPYLRTIHDDAHPIIWYSAHDETADYYARNVVNHGSYMTFEVVHADTVFSCTLHIAGVHNVANAVVAVAIGDWFGIPKEEIERGIEQQKPTGIRQHFTEVAGYHLFLDCYNNSAPAALKGAVKVLEGTTPEPGGRKIAVLADIILDERAPQANARVGDELSDSNIDIAFCFGTDNARILAEHLGKGRIETRFTSDRNELNEWIRSTVTQRDIVLFKGGVYHFLPRTIDQVFGTGLQLNNESKYDTVDGDHTDRYMFPKNQRADKTAAYVKYNGTASDPAIPSTSAEGIPYYAIGATCFEGNEHIKEVHIPEGVTHIGFKAFAGCTSLRKVTLPTTLLGIAPRAFEGCTHLKSISIPDGALEIGNKAFKGCSALRSARIPNSVQHIGAGAFRDCRLFVMRNHGGLALQWSGRRLFGIGLAK